MRILFLGDIVGSLGRATTAKLLPSLVKRDKVNLSLANAENIAHGRGATRLTIEEVKLAGVDYFTGGNHIFWQKEFSDEIENLPVLRPANFPEGTPGKGYVVVDTGRTGRVLVISLLGRTFIRDLADDPFATVDKILKKFEHEDLAARMVDMHAEATSEHLAMGFYLDGRVTAVVGTHTHVGTTDARILPNGTAYVTDVGMVGAWDSILGVKKEVIVRSFLSALPAKFEWPEEGPAVFNSVLIETQPNGLAKSIKRIDKIVD